MGSPPATGAAARPSPWVDLAVFAALLGALGACASLLGTLLMPFLVAAMAAYLLSPVADWLERRGLSRLRAVGLLYGLFAVAALAGAFFLVPALDQQIRSLHTKLPEYAAEGKAALTALQQAAEAKVPELRDYDLAATATTAASAYVDEQLKRLPGILLDVFTLLSILALIPIITWYFLLDGLQMKKRLVSLVPNRYFETVLHLIYRIDRQLSSYLGGLLVEALVVGLLSAVGYWLVGVRYSMMIGILSGLGNLIPYVGPVFGAAVALVVSVLEEGATVTLVSILVVAGGVQVVDNFLIQPAVFSKSVDLYPLTVLAVLLIGGDFFGLWGMVLGIPAYCIGRICVQEVVGVIRRYGAEVE